MKVYTWEDLCNYALIQQEKCNIAKNMRILSQCGKSTTTPGTERFIRRLNWKFLDVLQTAIDQLGTEIPDDKAKELGLWKKEEKAQ